MTDYLWCGGALIVLAFLIYWRNLSYKLGVWDGAFNQFLPHVQKAMREYDPIRAEQLLSKQETTHD